MQLHLFKVFGADIKEANGIYAIDDNKLTKDGTLADVSDIRYTLVNHCDDGENEGKEFVISTSFSGVWRIEDVTDGECQCLYTCGVSDALDLRRPKDFDWISSDSIYGAAGSRDIFVKPLGLVLSKRDDGTTLDAFFVKWAVSNVLEMAIKEVVLDHYCRARAALLRIQGSTEELFSLVLDTIDVQNAQNTPDSDFAEEPKRQTLMVPKILENAGKLKLKPMPVYILNQSHPWHYHNILM